MNLTVGYVHVRALLEGIEIPVVSAVVSGSVGQTSTAQVQIVPTDMAHRILPRSKIDIFFYDLYGMHGTTYTGESTLTATDRVGPVIPETTEEATGREGAETSVQTIHVPPELTRYRLMMTGEVLGIQVMKSSSHRVVVLQCAGNSSYWDLVAADKRGGALFGPSRQSVNAGLTTGPFWDLLMGNTGQVFEKLTDPPTSFPNLRGFSAGLMNIMESIFGVYHRRNRDGQRIKGANQFLSMANLRLRLMQQIGVAGGDDSPLRLLRVRGFGSIWQPALRGLPRYFSFRHMLNALMPYTFYEHTPILAPYYTPPTGTYASYMGWEGYDTGVLRSSPQFGWIPERADRIIETIDGWIDGTLADLREEALEDGVADPSNYRGLVQELVGDLRTGVSLMAQSIYDGTTSTVLTITEDAETSRETTTSHREAVRRLEPVSNKSLAIQRMSNALATRLEGGGTSLPGSYDESVVNDLRGIRQLASEVAGYVMPPPTRRDPDSDSEPARLYSDILRPDVWFCPPPRSNVFFPSQVVGYQYGRDFQSEATRLLVRSYDKWLGSHFFFDKWWIAPTAAGAFSGRVVMESGRVMSRIRRDLMAHELYTGIIPLFQKMGDREMYLGSKVAGYGSRASSPATDDQKRYFQNVTNFLLFKTRFRARALSVNTIFNPYVVLGFPAVVLEPNLNKASVLTNTEIINAAQQAMQNLTDDQQSVVLELIKNRTGVHYLGVIQQVTHTMVANGENCGTTILMNYAREHNEKIEYMGQDVIRLSQEVTRANGIRNARRRSRSADALIRYYGDVLGVLTDLNASVAVSSPSSEGRVFGDSGSLTGGLHTIQAFDGPALNTANMSVQDVRNWIEGQMSAASSAPLDNVQIEVQIPTTKTSVVFALRPPDVRQGTPPAEDDLAEEGETGGGAGYIPGQLGPNGGEIIEATDVTDQYQGRTRPRNYSGISAEEAARNQRILDLERPVLSEVQGNLSDLPPRDAEREAEMARSQAEVDHLEETVRDREERARAYEAGWRQVPLTLPFISSRLDGRNRPITSITTDRVGIPTDVRRIPELMSILGTPGREPQMEVLKVYRIVEDMSGVSDGLFDLGAEDVLRPPWYSSVWENSLIGGGVYLPLFGTGSVVDPLFVFRPDGTFDPEFARSDGETVGRYARQSTRRGDFSGSVMAGILEGATIENALDWLSHTYATTVLEGYDRDLFVRNYCWRPVATMFDLYGSGDLVIDADGGAPVSGVEGFHSRAFGPFSNLFGLLPYSDVTSLLGIDSTDVQAAARVDVRGRRYAIAQAYRLELLNMRGCAAG